jgi:hypothetical protein
MLEKIPGREVAPASADAAGIENIRPPRLDVLDSPSFHKLVSDACPVFARLANVPASDSEAVEYFDHALFSWIISSCRGDAYLVGWLSDVKHKAVALHRQLEKVHHRLEETNRLLEDGYYDNDYNLDLAMLEYLQPAEIAHLLRNLSALTDALGHFTTQKRGRRRGVKRYPGLSELVYELASSAPPPNGFTVHRKLGAKGTLVQALDWLRDRLLASPDLKHLADLIPTRDKHPIAVYERASTRAREQEQAGIVS